MFIDVILKALKFTTFVPVNNCNLTVLVYRALILLVDRMWTLLVMARKWLDVPCQRHTVLQRRQQQLQLRLTKQEDQMQREFTVYLQTCNFITGARYVVRTPQL